MIVKTLKSTINRYQSLFSLKSNTSSRSTRDEMSINLQNFSKYPDHLSRDHISRPCDQEFSRRALLYQNSPLLRPTKRGYVGASASKSSLVHCWASFVEGEAARTGLLGGNGPIFGEIACKSSRNR